MAMKHNERFLAVVNDAKARVRETDVETIAKRIEAGEEFHLIDVREDNEWARGHLPRAQHIGKGVIERDIEKLIPTPARRSYSTAAAASAPPSRQTSFRRWATRM